MTGRDKGSLTWVHASAVVVGEAGILIRGAPGAGKTTLALALVAEGRRDRRFGRLVADDTVALEEAGGRLLARPHPRTAGLAERRGVGIIRVAHEPACVVRLIVDLDTPDAEPPQRVPDAADLRATLLGVVLPRLALRPNGPSPDDAYRVLEFCHTFSLGS